VVVVVFAMYNNIYIVTDIFAEGLVVLGMVVAPKGKKLFDVTIMTIE
jgi:hypothetical protein